LTPKLRLTFLTYGLVAAVGSFSVLGYAVLKLGAYLIDKEQPMAFVFFAGLLGTKFRRRFRGIFGKSTGLSDPDDDFASAADASSDSAAHQTSGDSADTANEPEKPRTKRSPWLKRPIVAALRAAVVTPNLLFGAGPQKL